MTERDANDVGPDVADEVQPDHAAEALAEAWVHDEIDRERESERAADDAIHREEGAEIEREEDALGMNGLLGRIRAAFRRG